MGKRIKTKALRASTGRKVKVGDTLGVWYSGVLASDRSQSFDSNFDFDTATPTNNPFTFKVGSGQVIKGWDKALSKRRIGEVIEMLVPAALAYGEEGIPPTIPGNSDLLFTVELIALQRESSNNFMFPRFRDLQLDKQAVDLIVDHRRMLQGDSLAAESLVNILGNSLDNTLTGQDVGELKADLLIGFSGINTLTGGKGPDLLIGGNEADTYRYTSLTDAELRNANGATETIVNFDQSEGDKIDLSAISSGDFKKVSWINTNNFSGTPGQLRFGDGLLSLDADGDKDADFVISLLNVDNLSRKAFIL